MRTKLFDVYLLQNGWLVVVVVVLVELVSDESGEETNIIKIKFFNLKRTTA